MQHPSRRTVRGLAIASLVVNVGIVVSGGAVRLTGSGLGCPTWPRCTEDSLVPTAAHGIHGVIEFGNRMFTFAVAAVVLASFLAAWWHRPVRRDWRRPAAVILAGIPAQAVLGGITVLTGLNPWTVMLHLLLSMALIAVATVLVRRTARSEPLPAATVRGPLYGLSLAVSGVLAAVLYLGAVVTGSGPHAGDDAARRTGLDLETVSRVHADAVFVLIGLTVALVVVTYATSASAQLRRAVVLLLALELSQGVLGFAQYFLQLPALLVGLHLLGAALLVVAGTRVVVLVREEAARQTPPAGGPASAAPAAGGWTSPLPVRQRTETVPSR